MKKIVLSNLANNAYGHLPPHLKQRFRKLVPVGIRKSAKTLINNLGLYGPHVPLVSVVVPVYNVSDLLAECLTSIRNQTYRNLQIIVIDDGSTDSSLSIARSMAKNDRRIQVHTQDNAGLGAARNVGTRLARGKYLVFADSDDFIPPRSYETMVKTLQESGSDLVTGTFYRFNSSTNQVPKWCKTLHAEKRLGITLEEYLDGLVNVYAWNKMFRKSVWDSLGMSYTEGYRYEDQEPTTRMLIQAKSFDVIPDSVYGYRLRDDESSITQNKHLIRDVEDRLHVIRLTAKTIAATDNPMVMRAWVSKLIRYDLIAYLRESVDADAKYRAVVSDLCKFVFDACEGHAILHSPVKIRSLMALVLSDRWDALGKAILFSDETGPHLPTELGQTIQYAPPYRDQVSEEYVSFGLSLSKDETKAVGAFSSAIVSSSGEIQVEGWAFIKNISGNAVDKFPMIQVSAVHLESGQSVAMDTIRIPLSGASKWANSKWSNYDDSGFRATCSVFKLADALESRFDSDSLDEWSFSVDIEDAGQSRSTSLERRIGGSSASNLDGGRIVNGADWQWSFQEETGLTLSSNKRIVRMIPELSEGSLELTIIGTNSDVAKSARLVRGRKKIIAQREDLTDRVKFIFDLSKLPRTQSQSWFVKVRGLGATEKRLAFPNGESRVSLSEDYALRKDESGSVTLELFPQVLKITRLEHRADALILSGTTVTSDVQRDKLSLHLVSPRSVSKMVEVKWNDDAFAIEVPLVGRAGELLPYDGYSVRVVDELGLERPVLYDRTAALGLPLETVVNSHRIRLSMTKFGNAWIRLEPPLRDDEVGPYNQKKMQQKYIDYKGEVEKGTVLFHAYLGAHASDSSRAISEYLVEHRKDLRIVWATVSEAVEIPRGSHRVILNSNAWYDMMARAEFLVHNIYFDAWFAIKPGQKYLQTWHGTPLKTINRTYWNGIGRSQAWINRMDSQAASWTYLISPSPYYSEIVSLESGFTGGLLETGYPRNDQLVPSPRATNTRTNVREGLGIEAEDTVVLYAPTWREGLSTRSWKAEMVQFLDADELIENLGSGFKLLIRGHGHNARTASSQQTGNCVIDVTHHENINELYLAADVIVTDYSSVMFDAVVANKPLVFFVPDLKDYNASRRGVYLDISEIAPGPLLFSQEDLANTLRDLDSEALIASEEYIEFKKKYAPYEDGNSTKRVVDVVWKQ